MRQTSGQTFVGHLGAMPGAASPRHGGRRDAKRKPQRRSQKHREQQPGNHEPTHPHTLSYIDYRRLPDGKGLQKSQLLRSWYPEWLV